MIRITEWLDSIISTTREILLSRLKIACSDLLLMLTRRICQITPTRLLENSGMGRQRRRSHSFHIVPLIKTWNDNRLAVKP